MTRHSVRFPVPVMTGLDVLLGAPERDLKQHRVGLVTNPAGTTRGLRSNIDALREAGIDLVALYGPEHGIAAAAADAHWVASGRDARTGLPVFSLYGDERKPTHAMLAGVDLLLLDLQDVGVRFYTFTTTLALVLAACAENRLPLIVLDRPNPIGGLVVEGPLLDPALQSFIGHGRLPIRYGLTIGELARFYNRELGLEADLRLVPMQGWTRDLWFDDTSLVWVPPSPGMPQSSTAVVYPGTCLVEGTNLSEGRGTALPFEIAGAPWLDGYALAADLNARGLAGVLFRPVTFTPEAGKHAGVSCGGVQVHVTDRGAFRPVAAGLHLLAASRNQAPDRFEFLATSWEGRPPHLDLLTGTPRVRATLQADQSVDALVQEWAPDLAEFEHVRERYRLY